MKRLRPGGAVGANPDMLLAFLLELLADHRATDGWVKPVDVAKAAGVSRASAYRYLDIIETSGRVAVEHDPNFHTPDWRGVRANLVLARRDAPRHHQGTPA